MKKVPYKSVILIFVTVLLFALPVNVLADEKDDGRPLEMEVNGFHITLANQSEWTKGDNTIVVTITDDMGMPVKNAEVEILVATKLEGHTESETALHEAEPKESAHAMDTEESLTESTDTTVHDEENPAPIAMLESDEHGVYIAETHLEAVGKHEIHVMFLGNGEVLQADFVVEIPGISSKMLVLWSFVLVNIALVVSAGILKKQPIPVKGGQ